MPLPLAAIPAIVQGGLGLYQTLFGGRNKAIKEMEKKASSSPIYQGSKPISDYYEEAKNRYAVSPYQSNQYQVARQNIERGTAAGLNTLQGRGGALAGASRLVGAQNDALLKAGSMAEQERNQRFGQLGSATGMKSSDEMKKFQINQLDPYNRGMQLAMMKAGAAGAKSDAGLSNLFSGVGNASMLLAGGDSDKNISDILGSTKKVSQPQARQFAYDALGNKYYL